MARVSGQAKLQGRVTLPGDKSISHRALLLSGVASGDAHLSGLSTGADVASTTACMRALGVEIDGGRVRGVGLRGLRPAESPLPCGNSGTTMRLLAGLLAAQPFPSVLVGDESLSRRPMERVVAPLREMGAHARLAPLTVGGGPDQLTGIEHRSPVASAQVKSAVLLAGLYADGPTTVVEPTPTRNHTELMLRAMGALVEDRRGWVRLQPPAGLAPVDFTVPGDFSAAAFWLVAAALVPRARLEIPNTGLNPSRTALLGVLDKAGLRLAMRARRLAGAEPVADLLAGGDPDRLAPITVQGAAAGMLIDELPVIAVAATRLPGTSRITGAGELRLKECDRIAAMAAGLSALGADITELDDGWEIRGPRFLEGARVRSSGDHRVAMALAVAGLLADGVTEIEDADCAAISDPGFFDQLEALC